LLRSATNARAFLSPAGRLFKIPLAENQGSASGDIAVQCPCHIRVRKTKKIPDAEKNPGASQKILANLLSRQRITKKAHAVFRGLATRNQPV